MSEHGEEGESPAEHSGQKIASDIVPMRNLIISLVAAVILVASCLLVFYGSGNPILYGAETNLGQLALMLQIFLWTGVFMAGCICGYVWPRIFLGKMPEFMSRKRREPSKLTSGRVSLSIQAIVLLGFALILYNGAMAQGHSTFDFILYALAIVGMIVGFAILGGKTSLFSFIAIFAGLGIYIAGEMLFRLIG